MTCKAKEINDLDRIKMKFVDTKTYDYGLSRLGLFGKEKQNDNKKRICAAFREKTGLINDVVKQG